MALIKCYECSKEISDIAEACPHCGAGKAIECHECSKQISKGLNKCPHCGAPKFSILNSRTIIKFVKTNKVILIKVILFSLFLILAILSPLFLFVSQWPSDSHIYTGLICLIFTILTAIRLYAINTNKMVKIIIAIIITTTIGIIIYTYVNENNLQREITQEMIDDWYTGKGTYTHNDGYEKYKYVGEWKDGRWNGQGIYTANDGEGVYKYVGEFKDGNMHGQGTFTIEQGELKGVKYVGEFKYGKKHGQGTWTDNGSEYVGEWQNGKMHGQGTFTHNDGSIKEGLWENGEFLGEKIKSNIRF
jgi:hypothetical protein